MSTATSPEVPDDRASEFYLRALALLDEAGVRYLLGGGFALKCHTGIVRATKDLDLFVRPGESRYALDTLSERGIQTEWPWPHFLARALSPEGHFIDIVYRSGNGLTPVDDEWFEKAVEGDFNGKRLLLVPPEEMLWTKCFVQERDRFDGADVAHLILRCGGGLDWQRLLRRSLGHDAVLLAHLILFRYIYPTEQHLVPGWVTDELQARLARVPPEAERLCRGTNLAPHQYRPDVEQWGFADARREPHGPLRADDIARFAPPDAQPIR